MATFKAPEDWPSLTLYGRDFRYNPEVPPSKIVLFLERILFEDEHWIWTAGQSNGYGGFNWQNKSWPTHRFAWIAFRGAIPPLYEIHHECEITQCCNPDHLLPTSEADHLLIHTPRNPVYTEARKKFCKYGHEFSEQNTRLAFSDGYSHRVCRECRRIWQAERERRQKANIDRRAKTHCKAGHQYTPENTLIDHVGHKRCRICHNAASAKSYEKRAPEKPPKPPKTHCVNGHPWIPENWLHSKRGGKDTFDCMICHKEGAKRSYEKRKAEFAAKKSAQSGMLDIGGGE